MDDQHGRNVKHRNYDYGRGLWSTTRIDVFCYFLQNLRFIHVTNVLDTWILFIELLISPDLQFRRKYCYRFESVR